MPAPLADMDHQMQRDAGATTAGLQHHDAADLPSRNLPSVGPLLVETATRRHVFDKHAVQPPVSAAGCPQEYRIADDQHIALCQRVTSRQEKEHCPSPECRPVTSQLLAGCSLSPTELGRSTRGVPRQEMRLPTPPLPEPSTLCPLPSPSTLHQWPKPARCSQELNVSAPQHAGQTQDQIRTRSASPDGPASESLLASPLTHPNGASIFPSMSTNEQADMAREAMSQAEASIVAENFEEEIVRDDESDGGYSSDGLSSGSTSAESSVRDYLYENGRRYHRFREGTYNFPNDDVEQEREDMKHAMVKLLCSQKLHFAPIGDYPQEVLDIGTGTGIWAIEMGDQFPSAHVLGIDLSPIQPDWLPPNVRFLVDDVESPWLYPRNHFDYVHSRHTVMAVRDWMRLFQRAYEHIKPGGWIELQEIHHKPRSALPDGVVSDDHAVAKFWARVNEGLTSLGIDLDRAAGGFLAQKMRDAGFVNVTERIFHVPIGTWPKNKVLKTVGLYWRTILLDGLQAIALGPLTRGLNWNREQVELFLMEVRRAYHDNSALMYMPLHIIYAQKP
ncbi:hypothetical protein HIM_04752 [Hirsutella minnesotensis 3608]|uniref:Methyltransferase domain-containing protein n=1 Tax=Hirsutella minnesotensis 3608 TaxID=1043627 RepID=A0A0F7ZV36_9HYPO|nr:hypothetical protein HIM_04752 [Hirsutella minnesotensis 3608]